MTDNLRNIAAIIAIITSLIGGVLWLQKEFATNRVLFQTVIDARLEGTEDDIEQDSSWAAHYRRLERDGTITPGEKDRLDRLERSLEQKYQKAERLEAVQSELQTQ